jgi:hypothetical protein
MKLYLRLVVHLVLQNISVMSNLELEIFSGFEMTFGLMYLK